MTQLALCGLGRIGTVHLDNLRELRGCRITGLFDVRPEVAAQQSSRSGIPAYTTLAALLADPVAQAVVIATPTDSHREIVVAALAAGKHVFVEKPLAGTLEDARAIAEAARRSDRCVQVGFCERFNPQYLEARRAVREGRLGEIRAVHTSRIAPYADSDPQWELGVLDTAVHNLDLILWLVGRAPRSVACHGVRVYADSAIPHSVTTLVRFEGEALASDHIAWVKESAHPLGHCARSRMTLIGDEGVFDIDLAGRPASLLTAASYRLCDTVIIGGPGYYGCLKLQFEGFLRSIEEGAPVLAPVEDALLVERVALAARDALQSGAEVRLTGNP
jgi:predicted dehydrogenase